jgi:chromosome segregation ATPase
MSLNRLKSFFLEEDPPSPAPEDTPQASPKTAVISNTGPSTVPTVSPAEMTAIDQRLQTILLEAIASSGAPAYKALDDVVDSLEDVVPNVNDRYRKALQILTKQGHSPITILNDVDKVIGALEESSRQFEVDQKNHFQNSVGALHRSVETLGQQIAAKQAEIARLTQEVQTLAQKRDADAASIASEQAQIDHVEGRFKVVFNTFMSEVQSQRAAVEKLQAP